MSLPEEENGPGRQGLVIVAHPDDETIWCGGMLLLHPWINWTVLALCRANDADRSPRFLRAIRAFGGEGFITDLDDGIEQTPLPHDVVEQTILSMIDGRRFDWLVTHSPWGEYTRHRRHEETAQAVMDLWEKGKLNPRRLLLFAYEDGGKQYVPRAIAHAHRYLRLPDDIYKKKIEIVTRVYGFAEDSFEAQAARQEEAFWEFNTPRDARTWYQMHAL